jgi:ATP-dependent DNA ligase
MREEWTKTDFYDKYYRMTPGKYWKMTATHKAKLPSYMKNDDYLAMVKYDGYWSRIIIGEDKIVIQTRGISKVTNDYGRYEEKVPHIVKELLHAYPAGTVLLGEMCYNDITRTAVEVGKVMRCNPDKAIERQKVEVDRIHLRIFDVLAYGFKELHTKNFIDRFIPEYAVPGWTNDDDGVDSYENGYYYISPVRVGEPGQSNELLDEVLLAGGEGIILVHKHQPYNTGGAKAWHSIKVKKALGNLEGLVVSIIEPKREYDGSTSLEHWKFWENSVPVTKPYFNGWKSGVVVDYKGKLIRITSGTTDDDGAWLAEEGTQEMIRRGELHVVFSGMEETPDSVRHPYIVRFRDDM